MIFRKNAFFAFGVSLAAILSGCHEDEKIAELQKELVRLETQADSLQNAVNTMSAVKPLTILSDTVRAGEGPFHVFSRLKAMVEGRVRY